LGGSKVSASVLTAAKTNQNLIWLDPTVLVVSAERIKQTLLQELGAGSPWRGKIFLALYPAETPQQIPVIVSWRTRDSWQYRVELPVITDRELYVRAMVQVLLLELANRGGPERSADIPVWLVEGLSQQLLMSMEIEILLATPHDSGNRPVVISANISGTRESPLERAQKNLKSREPLSFEQLSWPLDSQDIGEEGLIYRSSAQIFLTELLQLKDGQACLRAMLAELPNYYNWQLAFLKGFHPHFQHVVDVEKWWALEVVHFNTRDALAQTWGFEESSRKLAQALHATVELHTGTNESPLIAEVPLQRMLREAPRAGQTATLQIKSRQLVMLRCRVAEEFVVLIDNYRQVLDNYLQHEPKRGLFKLFTTKGQEQRLAEETAQVLDYLDAVRASLQPNQKPIIARKP